MADEEKKEEEPVEGKEEKKGEGMTETIEGIVKKPLEMAGDVIEGVMGIIGVKEKKKAEGGGGN